MTSKFSIDNRDLLQRISSGEAVVGIDFGNLIVRELAAFRLAAMDSSESVELPLDYLQGHKDGLEWAAQLAEANHPETGDWLYDDPIELAKAIRKGTDMPPVQPVADSEPDRNPVLAYADSYRDMAKQGVESVPIWSVITDLERNIAPLYRHAQPVTVVPDEVTAEDCPALVKYDVTEVDEAWARGFNSCRAAMLQAYPVCTCPSGDGSLRRPCPVHPGNSPAIGIDMASGQDRTVEVRYVAPPGYVMVPKEPTDEMIAAAMNCEDVLFNSDDSFCVQFGNIYEAMLAAAPHDTPALNSIQSVDTVADRWIPVSERMPPSRHEVLVGRWWGEKPRWCCKWATYIPGHPDAQSSGWLIPGASWTPTHWMPLPAAPQEVK
ncbi:DUF551 domain-containing protein [Klebsiella pneumoniae]